MNTSKLKNSVLGFLIFALLSVMAQASSVCEYVPKLSTASPDPSTGCNQGWYNNGVSCRHPQFHEDAKQFERFWMANEEAQQKCCNAASLSEIGQCLDSVLQAPENVVSNHSLYDYNGPLRVWVDRDTTSIKSDHADEIAEFAKLLKMDYRRIRLNGHANFSGNRDEDMRTGDVNANLLKNALIEHGIFRDLIEVVSYGSEKLGFANPESLKNNRVEVQW